MSPTNTNTPPTYSARTVLVDGIDVVRLADDSRGMRVSIAPSIGNNAYEFTVNGVDLLWSPYTSLAEFRDQPVLLGIPFLAPWANRLDQEAFFANGAKYLLNPGLGNLRYDENGLPIHGLVSFTPHWEVISLSADASGAEVTSRLEFWRYPDWMAQFPFAHTITITHRLSEGTLEVRTAAENHAREPLPISLAYHPYFRIADTPRDHWTVHLAARRRYTLSEKLLPTGDSHSIDWPDPLPLASRRVDDVFGDIAPGGEFWVQGARQRITLRYGARYPVAIVYAPPDRDFICFEPMTGLTNAFNLAHAGAYDELQSVPPGGRWQESFWIRPSGY